MPLGPPGASPQGRLDSWKEIAAYLGRCVRTVQRWERQEGLPIRRLQHDKLGSVYASREEIDAWWGERRVRLEAGEADRGTAARHTALAAALALAAMAVLPASRVGNPARIVPAGARLAVLPFANLTGDAGQEYLTDGFTDEMITRLGQLRGGVAVIARTSVMRYKRTDASAREIGRVLKADYLLEGGMRRSEQRLRVTAQLVRVADETQLWTETYDSDGAGGDLLAIQAALAWRIVQGLQVQLAPIAEAPPAVDPRAHLAYLKGRYSTSLRTEAELRNAIAHYHEALRLEPRYAEAYAGLADAHDILSNYTGERPPPGAISEAVARALAFGDTLAEAHTSKAALLEEDWNWQEAEKEYQRALALNPSYATAHHWYGLLLLRQGRFEEARREVDGALDLDPLSLGPNFARAVVSYFAGDAPGALTQLRRTIELYPDFSMLHMVQVQVLTAQGRFSEALAELDEAERLAPGTQRHHIARAFVEARVGRVADARRRLGALPPPDAGSAASPFYEAWAWAALADKERAFACLEQAYAEHDPHIAELKVTPELAGLRADPRFADLLKRMGLQ